MQNSGVALLMALGILALLAILAVAFATSMRYAERTSRDFKYEQQASEFKGNLRGNLSGRSPFY